MPIGLATAPAEPARSAPIRPGPVGAFSRHFKTFRAPDTTSSEGTPRHGPELFPLLVLGQALTQALGDRKGIRRYGYSMLPMDEALARVAIDLGGRPYLVYEVNHAERKIREFDLGLLEEFFRAFTTEGRLNLHAAHLYGKDLHHAYESIFKGVAKALDMALSLDPRVAGVPSSKGAI